MRGAWTKPIQGQPWRALVYSLRVHALLPVGSSTLRARFPTDFPTHSQIQEFHVDPKTALLTQHDYTAGVFGNWAKGAHCVLAHEPIDGIPFGTHRRVTPGGKDGKPSPFPLLVGIEFDEIVIDP